MTIKEAGISWGCMVILLCVVNLVTFFMILFRKRLFRSSRIGSFKGSKLLVEIILTILVLIDYLNIYKGAYFFDVYSSIQLLSQILGMAAVLILWTGMEYDRKNKEDELRMYELYNRAYEDTVQAIRMRQHEFENHLNAILCLGNTIDNYQELVLAQKEYCMNMIQQNNSNKILKLGVEPVITGFLYTKISLAESLGIDVQCEVHTIETKRIVKTYDLIEMIGILFDNAIDALKEYENPKIRVRLVWDEQMGFVVEIANTSRIFKNSELEKFCEYGYSSKGAERGLGLARLKMVVDKNNAALSIQNETIEERNYLCFRIVLGR